MNEEIDSAISNEESRAEEIAALAQLLLISFFFIVYYFTPKGFTDTTSIWFEPVSTLLCLYIPILLLRNLHTQISKNISIGYYIYIAIDVILLSLLIFSYHIQYNQPLTLSLRSPTFLYFFIFLVLRCLSYDFFKIIYTGFLIAAIWATITYYAYSDTGLIRSRNFADYLKPNTFILGVEIDKLLSLLAATIVCSIAVYRKRKLLVNFSHKVVLTNLFEKLIGREALYAAAPEVSNFLPGTGAKRTAATVMIDLRGFSKLSFALPVENLMVLLDEYYSIVATSVFKYNGSIDKYMGDGVLAHFGAVTAHANYACNALKAAEEIYANLNDWKNKLQSKNISTDFGISVCTGEVIFGIIGHKERMEITVIGESVNLCAKLEKHNKILDFNLITTIKTFETAKSQGYTPTDKWLHKDNEQISGVPHTINLIGYRS